MQHLTACERERLAYLAGDLHASEAFAFMDEAAQHNLEDGLDVAEAAEYREVATDCRGINSPADLRKRLGELHDLEAAMPDNCGDAADLKKWASEAEDITTERDNLRESLAAVALVLKKKKGAMGSAEIKELIDWLDYAVNETGPGSGIDAQRLADDLGVDL